jgi:transposase InsO family protein
LVVLLGRRECSKEVEILALRHELSILRRHARWPRFEPPRPATARGSQPDAAAPFVAFVVLPETLLRWHRRLRAPNANAHVECWVGSVRRECLDRLLIFNRRQLEGVLRVYVRHYNEQRPHRALALQAPDPPTTLTTRDDVAGSAIAIRRRDLLGGLIHEYEAAAA